MPESREDERFKQDAIDDDLESLEELLEDTYLSAPGVSRRPRVEVGLVLLLKGAKKGYTIDELVDDLDNYVVATYLSALLAAGANPGKLVSRLSDDDVVKHLDELLDAGAEIDVDKLIDKIPDKSKIIWALPKLVAAGADKAKLGRRLGELLDDGRYLNDFLGNLDVIRESGVDGVTPDRLMQGLEARSIRFLHIKPSYIADKLDALLRFGVDPDRLARLANSMPYLLDVRQWGNKLRAAGADPELLQSYLDS